MAIYFLRIQLIGAEPKDYQPMYEAAEVLGFRDFIYDRNLDQWEKLPTGLYVVGTSLTGQQVHDLAVGLTKKSKHKARIIVIKSATEDLWATGLEPYERK